MDRRGRTRALLVLIIALHGCAVAPPALTSFHGECRRDEAWLEQFAIRRAVAPDSALAATQRAGLAIQARAAVGTADSLLRGAQLRVFSSDTATATTLVVADSADANGWLSVDLPSARTVFVQARWFGFAPRGEAVTLRSGFRDTVIVHLRRQVVCLSRAPWMRSPDGIGTADVTAAWTQGYFVGLLSAPSP